ncbi:hypothetical protein OROGR_019981 [Orobanche gracilis]
MIHGYTVTTRQDTPRCGRFDEALEMIRVAENITFVSDGKISMEDIWRTLAARCYDDQISNYKLGIEAFRRVVNKNGADIKLLANLHANERDYRASSELMEKCPRPRTRAAFSRTE